MICPTLGPSRGEVRKTFILLRISAGNNYLKYCPNCCSYLWPLFSKKKLSNLKMFRIIISLVLVTIDSNAIQLQLVIVFFCQNLT
jgi:hypothetical protein